MLCITKTVKFIYKFCIVFNQLIKFGDLMITKKMLEFLKRAEKDPQLKKEPKYAVYLNRIQKKIDKDMDNMMVLAKYFPDLLLDEEREWKDETGKIISHRRLKKLLLTIKLLNPKMEVELVLKNLDFPEQEIELVNDLTKPRIS